MPEFTVLLFFFASCSLHSFFTFTFPDLPRGNPSRLRLFFLLFSFKQPPQQQQRRLLLLQDPKVHRFFADAVQTRRNFPLFSLPTMIPSSFDPAPQICVVVGALLIIFSLSLDAGCCRKKSRTDDRCISPARRRRPPLQKRMNGNLFRDDQKFSLPSRLKQRFFPGLLLQQYKRQEGRWPKNAVSFGSL